MDREFAVVLHRALLMIVRYLEKRFNLGKDHVVPEVNADQWPGYHDV